MFINIYQYVLFTVTTIYLLLLKLSIKKKLELKYSIFSVLKSYFYFQISKFTLNIFDSYL